MATDNLRKGRIGVLCRTLCIFCALAAAWASVLTLTGGVDFLLGSIRVRSNNPRNPALLAVLSATVLWLLSRSSDGRTALQAERAHWLRLWASTAGWRARWLPVFDSLVSPITVAIIGIGFDISQWAAALPLWADEEMIALNVRDRSFADLAGTLWLGQSAPLGWLALERSIVIGLGTSEHALRLVPLLFGVATLITAVWIGRRWMGRVAAIVFVLLCWIGRELAHYRFEFKHYTADVFFALTIPALAAWVVEAENGRDRMRRALIWWAVAAIGQWLSNGALLVAPACGLFLFVSLWRRNGMRDAAVFAVAWLMWLASFGLHYQLSVRHIADNEYLQDYWAAELLPASAGVTDSLHWFISRLEPLAVNPGGTELWASLWISAICGLVFARQRALGLAFAGAPLSAFAFAAFVPLIQRHSIWIVPALYAGIALLVDRTIGLGTHALARRRWPIVVLAVAVLLVELRLSASIYDRGKLALNARRQEDHKHRLDDRAAIRWLMSQWQPGDVVVTTRLAMPAVWWYGDIPMSDEGGAGSVLRDGGPIYEVTPGSGCPSRQLEDALKNRGRVLLYLGFDVDPQVDEALLRELSQLGSLTSHREFSVLGRAGVVDLRAPASDNSLMRLRRPFDGEPPTTRGCNSVKRARRW